MEELLSRRKRYAEEIRITAVCGERQIPVIRSCLGDDGIVYRTEHMDVGLILRSGTLLVDPDRLFTEAKEYLSHRHQRAMEEATWLVENEVDVAVCDMPLWSIRPRNPKVSAYIANTVIRVRWALISH